MSDSNVFKTAFNVFLKEGRFELFNSKLSLKQLQIVKDHIKKYTTVTTDIPFYEIHLNDVELVPFHIEELIESKGYVDTVLSGDLAEQELPASLKSRPEFNSEDKALRILNYTERSEHLQRVDYEYAVEAIEKTLLSLFEVAKWKIIKLEDISIVGKKDENKPLNFQFMYALYSALSLYTDQIKELSLKKVDLFNKDGLVNLLKKASKLEILRLEDIQQEKNIFPSLNTPNVLLDHLCETLAYHSTLRQLDLSNTTLNEDDYAKLFELLNTNYRLDKIFFKYPQTYGNLNQLHYELIRQLEERSKKSSLVRFQEKQLTSHNLYKLSALILELDKSYPIKISMSQSTKKLVISHNDNLALSNKLIQKLPKGLRRYPEYLQQSWPIQLDVSQSLDNQTTIGSNLLEKSFQLRKPNAMRLLLAAGADLLERLPGKPSLVEQVFLEKEEKIYKQLIIEHVKKDLSIFVPFISRLMPTYKKIDTGLRKVKSHLDQFVTTLLELDQLPLILKIFKGIGLETKKENWEKDFRLVVQAAKAGTHKHPITHSNLSDFESILQVLYLEVEKTKKQWFRGYQFNSKLLESLKQLLQSTREYQSDLFREWEQREGGTLTENTQLKEQLKRSQGTIEKMVQDLADQEVKFEGKRTQDRAEMRTEFEVIRTQDLTDQEAKFEEKRMQDRAEMRVEFEVIRTQDRAEMRTEFEVIRAQDKAEMEAKINKLLDHFTSQKQATPDLRPQENSTRFFSNP